MKTICVIIIFTFLPILTGRVEAATEKREKSADNQLDKIAGFLKKKIKEETKKIIFDKSADAENSAEDSDNRKDDQKKEKKKKVPKSAPSLKEIEKQAEFASEKTGVRKDFLMGMLTVETALGQKTGDCTYQEVQDGARKAYQEGRLSERAWNTFLERRQIIEGIAEDLGYESDKLKVSCNPEYAGTGGAMGIPQFMPDTWMEYKDRVAKVVGKDHPDPWDARDGIVAMALKVADCPGVTEHNVWAERNASKLYLSGTTSWQYDWYASQIQYWAQNYKELIG